MKFKRLLILVMTISALVYGLYAARVFERVSGIFEVLRDDMFWLYAVVAFGLMLAGHWVRAFKIQRLLRPVKTSGIRTQFQALLIGYLFNTLLPARLGEFVRAFVLGRSLQISSSFMFALIVVERVVDGLILALLGLLLVVYPGLLPTSIRTGVLVIALALLTVSLVLAVVLILLHRQNTKLLRFWHGFTNIFNQHLKNSLRFKLWSVIYGLHKTLNYRSLSIYAVRSLGMWVLYLASVTVLAAYFFPGELVTNVIRSLVSFLGVSAPSGPAYLGSYQAVADPLFQTLASGAQSLNLLVASWLLLAIPSSVMGAILLLRHRTNYSKLMASRGKDSLYDKLARTEDISQEFETFLDAYFSRSELSHILHRLEIHEDIRLIRYFKGGSDASTLLMHQNDKYVVKKITPIQYAHRLKAQHSWLKKHESLDKIVNVTGEREGKDFYYIDIEYHADLIPYFDYIHANSTKLSKSTLAGIFRYLFDNVYQLEPKKRHIVDVETYIHNKVYQKLDQASRLNLELSRLRDYETIVVNGVEYDNIHVVLEKIKKTPTIWKDLTTYRQSTLIHGDTQVDNILVSTKDHSFKIIDPVDQNEVMSPVVDFGRMAQSLNYGYEFLCRDDTPVIPNGNVVSFEDSISAAYRELYGHFRTIAKELLTPEEYRSILFHTAVHYSRMSTHRVEINPANAAKFYAVSVRAFNDFLAQYK
jgi:uncharacterized protein (TIRG00374 family)